MQFFKNLLGIKDDVLWKNESGSFVIAYGNNQVKIDTKDTPTKVWLRPATPNNCLPVCGGEVNMVGVEIVNNGFIIYADIKTDKCVVDWFAELL